MGTLNELLKKNADLEEELAQVKSKLGEYYFYHSLSYGDCYERYAKEKENGDLTIKEGFIFEMVNHKLLSLERDLGISEKKREIVWDYVSDNDVNEITKRFEELEKLGF